jgi:hypothetical protein
MKQTAVEWLEKEIFKYMQGSNIIDLFNQAKKMEKEQIIDANIKGHNAPSSTIKHFDAEQYYNEKFNTK